MYAHPALFERVQFVCIYIYYTILYYTIIYYTILYYTILYYTVHGQFEVHTYLWVAVDTHACIYYYVAT